VSDQDWQNAVLHDLGVQRSGLATPANPSEPVVSSEAAAAYAVQVHPPASVPLPPLPAEPDSSPGEPPPLAPLPEPYENGAQIHNGRPDLWSAGLTETEQSARQPLERFQSPLDPAQQPGEQSSDPWGIEPSPQPQAPPESDAGEVAWDSPAPDSQPAQETVEPPKRGFPSFWDQQGEQPQATQQQTPTQQEQEQVPSDQEHPDLAHPDLTFPELAHPSLGLSESEPRSTIQPDQEFQDEWRRHTGRQPSQGQQPQPAQRDQSQQTAMPAAPPSQGAQQPIDPRAFAADLLRKSRHGDPLMRRMGRGLSKAVGASAAQDARETADLADRIQRPVHTCRRIAVTSIRGGAGKTTMAGLTATVLTQYRQDRILAVDADSGLGSLPLRMGVQTTLSLQDLARSRPRSWEEATRFLAQSSSGLWILSNTSQGRIGAELELETFRTATGEISRYFSAIIIDCGAGLLPELQRGILAEAHAHALVTPATVDGALSARGALDWMASNGYGALLPRTVVILVTHSPHEDADLERARHMLSAGGVTVVHVPYDRHLASGTPIELSLTGEAARSAASRIAAEVFSRAVSV
jgi:MinD-like ATPase involved in chromosome partitioning or flagellar assembly